MKFTNRDADSLGGRCEPPIELPDAQTPFEELIPSDRSSIEPFEVVRELRENTRALPPNAETFRLCDVLDSFNSRGLRHELFVHAMIWPVPPWFTGSEKKNRRLYVHSWGEESSVYGDVAVACSCGGTITTLGHEDQHKSDCGDAMRAMATDRLEARRADAIRYLLRHGWSRRAINRRLGYSGASLRLIDFGIDADAEREVYRQKMARTAFERLGELPVEEMASVLDRSERWLKTAIQDCVGKDVYYHRLTGGGG